MLSVISKIEVKKNQVLLSSIKIYCKTVASEYRSCVALVVLLDKKIILYKI